MWRRVARVSASTNSTAPTCHPAWASAFRSWRLSRSRPHRTRWARSRERLRIPPLSSTKGARHMHCPYRTVLLDAVERDPRSDRAISIAAVGHESAIRSLRRALDMRVSDHRGPLPRTRSATRHQRAWNFDQFVLRARRTPTRAAQRHRQDLSNHHRAPSPQSPASPPRQSPKLNSQLDHRRHSAFNHSISPARQQPHHYPKGLRASLAAERKCRSSELPLRPRERNKARCDPRQLLRNRAKAVRRGTTPETLARYYPRIQAALDEQYRDKRKTP